MIAAGTRTVMAARNDLKLLLRYRSTMFKPGSTGEPDACLALGTNPPDPLYLLQQGASPIML